MAPMQLPPLRFEPWIRPMVWGARRLIDSLGKISPGQGTFGESWELSDHPQHASRVASGPLAGSLGGKTLRQLIEQNPSQVLGDAMPALGGRFPLLVKWLDAADWLSVQVHPDTEAVKRLLPGEGSKTEAWLILKAEPGAKVWAGLKPGVGEKEMRQAIAAGQSADCLHSFIPRAGQFLFLPAGTVHAVGGGVLMAEIQQTSDATFRLFDWNRVDAQGKSRPLHIEESIASIHWDKGPVSPLDIPGFGANQSEQNLTLVDCPFFHLGYRRLLKDWTVPVSSHPRVVMVVGGSGTLSGTTGSESIRVGDSLLIPPHCVGATFKADPCLELWLGEAKGTP